MCRSWSGYMSQATNTEILKESCILLLPIIDLHATDPSALYSLLLFVTEQCKILNVDMPCVTLDQQLYVKAFEIESSMKMIISVCLGGFHQLMSFLGSIGKVIEGSGIGAALETVYTPVTVSCMFSGKAYARVVWGHLLCASAVKLILLKEFWDILNSDQQNELKNIYKSEDPSRFVNGDISIELMVWLSEKKKRTKWNTMHLSIMDKLYHIYLNCTRIHLSWKNQ